jgi:outer membrane receptor protein involved in Fe transport
MDERRARTALWGPAVGRGLAVGQGGNLSAIFAACNLLGSKGFMRRLFNYSISLTLAAATWGLDGDAEAQSPRVPAAPTDASAVPAAAAAPAPSSAPAAASTATPVVTAAPAPPSTAAGLSEAEVITVWAERPDKPFDRDTKLRLTGEELAARGATDLAGALALLPDVTVREGGRGGLNIDVRGARKGSVRILIDGVSVSDPYYGTFDVSTIPVTDIEQIRVSTSPSSPIDGPGGPGGVIEVHTRDAIGAQLVRARLVSDTAPSASVSASTRVALGEHSALRLSGSGQAGARDFSLPMSSSVGESRRSATGATRLEYRRGDRRVAVDAGIDDRHYLSPPSDERANAILLIDRETTWRTQLAVDDKVGKLQLQGRAWADRLRRDSRSFIDATLSDETSSEELRALRVGASALATRPIGRSARWAASATVDRDAAEVRSGGASSKGDAIIAELATDAQLERRGLLIDGAVGVALPFGIGADPWPEAKLDVRYTPVAGIELDAIAARKGRPPSLRERFDSTSGNQALDPELASHGEVRLTATRGGAQLEVAPFLRRTTGAVRIDPKLQKQTNLGTLDFRGIDTSVKAALPSAGGVATQLGGAYSYVTATSDLTGADPLDRLPKHRFDLWASAAPRPKLLALARLRYFGRRIDQTERLGAYTTVEASVSGEFGQGYLAVLRVDDLLDVRPETRSGYHTEGRTFTVTLQGTWP